MSLSNRESRSRDVNSGQLSESQLKIALVQRHFVLVFQCGSNALTNVFVDVIAPPSISSLSIFTLERVSLMAAIGSRLY